MPHERNMITAVITGEIPFAPIEPRELGGFSIDRKQLSTW